MREWASEWVRNWEIRSLTGFERGMCFAVIWTKPGDFKQNKTTLEYCNYEGCISKQDVRYSEWWHFDNIRATSLRSGGSIKRFVHHWVFRHHIYIINNTLTYSINKRSSVIITGTTKWVPNPPFKWHQFIYYFIINSFEDWVPIAFF